MKTETEALRYKEKHHGNPSRLKQQSAGRPFSI